MKTESIPKIFRWMIRGFLPKEDYDFLIADMEEVYLTIRAEQGKIIAQFWLLFQMLRSIPILINDKIFWGYNMFKSYLKIAARNIIRHKTFSAINIIGFAISLALCLFTIQFIFALYDVDRFHEDKDRIYRINTYHMGYANYVSEMATSPMPIAGELKELKSVENSVRIKNGFNGDIKTNDSYLGVKGIFADNNFFQVFSFPMELGDIKTALAEPNSIVLTKDVADKLFPGADPVGKTLSFNRMGEFTITGVMSDFSITSTHMKFEVLVSVETLNRLEQEKLVSKSLTDWTNFYDNYTFVLLKEGQDISELKKYLPNIVDKYFTEEDKMAGFNIQPLTGISPGPRLSNSMGSITDYVFIIILVFIALIILAIASFNYTNLTVAKALSRAKEVGIRKVIGAKRKDLFIQFVSEAVIIALISFAIAMIFLPLSIQAIYSFDSHFQTMFDLEAQLGLPLFFAFAGFALLTGIVSGLFPALYLSRFNPAAVLKDITKSSGRSKFGFKKVLVVIQFSVSIIFIIFTITGFQQLAHTRAAHLGFNYNNIININLQSVEFQKFKTEIGNFAGIESISSSEIIPGTGVGIYDIYTDENNRVMQVNSFSVDEKFIPTLEVELIAGKNFEQASISKEQTYAIINEKAIELLGLSNPAEAIGKIVKLERMENLQIIGVVKDFVTVNSSNHIDPLFMVYMPKYFGNASIKIDPRRQADVLEHIKNKWSELDPVHPLEYRFFEEQIEESLTDQDIIMKLAGFLTILIIFIAFFGLLGMVIFTTESKVKEIGIRKVMGASINEIVMAISKAFIKILIVSVIISVPFAYLLSGLFVSQMVQQIDIGVFPFVIGTLLVLLVGSLVIFPQVYRAAHTNPVESLRSE